MKKTIQFIISVITTMAFIINIMSIDGLAIVDLTGFDTPDLIQNSQINCQTFTLPDHLGEVKGICKGTSNKTIIHIQDAHCNYYAQKKISDIIDYLVEEYGVEIMNLEGGAGEYDLSPFTEISGTEIRREVSDYFLKKGEINAGEYYAINNPEKIKLWGIEDKGLYLKNLEVYRNNLKTRSETDQTIDQLSRLIDTFKLKFYNNKLMDLDLYYSRYKSGDIEFKEYLLFLFDEGKKINIPVVKFNNLQQLYNSLVLEAEIDFTEANSERNTLVDELKQKLSKKEQRDLMTQLIDYKTRKIAKKDFYSYLMEKGKEINFNEKDFSNFVKYFKYITAYGKVNRSLVTEEMSEYENIIKEHYFENMIQKELSELSRNLAILKNFFAFTLTLEDYKYYKTNVNRFDLKNYEAFIIKHEQQYDKSFISELSKLDEQRAIISRFFEYSFERDITFIDNLRFSREDKEENSPQISIILTGGFHTENLCELFKQNDMSYVSLMPRFCSEKNYKNPYFELLAGQTTEIARMLNTALAKTSTLMVANKLNPVLRDAVYGDNADIILRGEILIREAVKNGFQVVLRRNENDNSPEVFGTMKKGVLDLSADLLIEKIKKRESLENLTVDSENLGEKTESNISDLGAGTSADTGGNVIRRIKDKLSKSGSISILNLIKYIILISAFIIPFKSYIVMAGTNDIPLFHQFKSTIEQTYEYAKKQSEIYMEKYRISENATRALIEPIKDLTNDPAIFNIANISESIKISNSPEYQDLSRKAHDLLVVKDLLDPEDHYAPILFLKGFKKKGWAMAVFDPGIIVVGLDALKEIEASGLDIVEELASMIPHEFKHLRNRIEKPFISRLEDEKDAFWETFRATKVFSKDKKQIKAQEMVAKAFRTLVKKKNLITKMMDAKSFYDLYYSGIDMVIEKNKIVAVDIYIFDTSTPDRRTTKIRVKGNKVEAFILKRSSLEKKNTPFLIANVNPDLFLSNIYERNYMLAELSVDKGNKLLTNGNIGAGLDDPVQLESWKRQVLISKKDVPGNMQEIIKKASKDLIERLLKYLKNTKGIENPRREDIFQFFRGQIEESALKASEKNRLLSNLARAINSPQMFFKYMVTRVENSEKYLLGSENVLAVDLIAFLEEIENDKSIEPEKRKGLVAEYIFHEIMENTTLDHYEIIQLSSRIFDRKVNFDELKEGNVGQTPLGTAFRKFINRESNKSSDLRKIEQLIRDLLKETDEIGMIDVGNQIRDLMEKITDKEKIYIINNYLKGIYGKGNSYYELVSNEEISSEDELEGILSRILTNNKGEILDGLLQIVKKTPDKARFIWENLAYNDLDGETILSALRAADMSINSLAEQAIDPYSDFSEPISLVIKKILDSKKIATDETKNIAYNILQKLTQKMRSEELVSKTALIFARELYMITEPEKIGALSTDKNVRMNEYIEELWILNNIFQHVRELIIAKHSKGEEISYQIISDEITEKFSDDMRSLRKERVVSLKLALLEFFIQRNIDENNFDVYKALCPIEELNQVSKKIIELYQQLDSAKRNNDIAEMNIIRSKIKIERDKLSDLKYSQSQKSDRLQRFFQDEFGLDKENIPELAVVSMGPFCVELHTDLKSLNQMREEKPVLNKTAPLDQILKKNSQPDINFNVLKQISEELTGYINVNFHDELTASMTKAYLRGTAFTEVFDAYIEAYKTSIIEKILMISKIDENDTRAKEEVRKIVNNSFTGKSGKNFRTKMRKIKKDLDHMIDLKATLLFNKRQENITGKKRIQLTEEVYNEAAQFVMGIFQFIPLEYPQMLKLISERLTAELKSAGIRESDILSITPARANKIFYKFRQKGSDIYGFYFKGKVVTRITDNESLLDHERQHYINSILSKYVMDNNLGIIDFLKKVRSEAVNYSGFIGKPIDANGNVIDRVTNVTEENNTVTVFNENAVIAKIPVLKKNGRIKNLTKDQLLKNINKGTEALENLPGQFKGKIKDLIDLIGNDRIEEVVLLEQSAGNPDIKGFFYGNKLYVNGSLFENPLSLIHELGEEYVKLPTGEDYSAMSRHTFMRGAGKDVRNAFDELLFQNKILEDIEFDGLFQMLEEQLSKMAEEGRVSQTRITQMKNKQQPGFISESERALMRYNYDNGVKGKKSLRGAQDWIDPAGNISLTNKIQMLTDDLRQDTVNIFIIPMGPIDAQQTQISLSREASQKLNKKDIGTRVFHYKDISEIPDILTKAISYANETNNKDKVPKIFVHTFEKLDDVKASINDKLNKEYVNDKERIEKMLVYGRDMLPDGTDLKNMKVDDVRIIAIGTSILNDNRLSVDFGLSKDRLFENRLRMIKAFIETGILISDIKIDYSPEGLDILMKKLYEGEISLRILPINWDSIPEYYDSMKQVLRSL